MPSRSKCPVWLYAVVALAVVVLIGTAVALGMNESFANGDASSNAGQQCNWYLANRDTSDSQCNFFTIPKDLHVEQQMKIDPKNLLICTNNNLTDCTSLHTEIANYKTSMQAKLQTAITKAQNTINQYKQSNKALETQITNAIADQSKNTQQISTLKNELVAEIGDLQNMKNAATSFQNSCGCDDRISTA